MLKDYNCNERVKLLSAPEFSSAGDGRTSVIFLRRMRCEGMYLEISWKVPGVFLCRGWLRVGRWQVNYNNFCILAVWKWNLWTWVSDRNLSILRHSIPFLVVKLLILSASLFVANYMLYIHIYANAYTHIFIDIHIFICLFWKHIMYSQVQI